MEKKEALERLKALDSIICEYETTKANLDRAKTKLGNATNSYPSKLNAFDNATKESFIAERIGNKPVKPTGPIKLAVPVYLVKKSNYEKALHDYEEMRSQAENDYMESYSETRAKLEAEDKAGYQNAVEKAREALSIAQKAFDYAKDKLATDDLISDKLKNKETVWTLIEYFKDQRADTLKEAVNLWYDEKRKDEEEARAEEHRREMRALEEEKVRAAQAAEEYARMQYEESLNAAEAARQAADTAQRIEWNQSYSYNS